MLVKDCMTAKPITIEPTEDVQYAFFLLKKHEIKQLPVIEDGKLIGIITERDLRMVIEKEYGIKIRSAMSTNIQTINENDNLEIAAETLIKRNFNALPVLDDKGELVGIIAATDIISGLLNIINQLKQ